MNVAAPATTDVRMPLRLLDHAACGGIADPELFCRGGQIAARRRMCLACPVLLECRDYIDDLERHSSRKCWHDFWAAESPAERGRRRRRGW